MTRDTASPRTEAAPSFLFGPAPHNAWRQKEDCISLVRAPLRPVAVRLDAQPQRIEIDLARCALVVIDMQNDFCHPQGWFGQKGIDVAPMRRPIPAIARLLTAWRTAGAGVVWVNWGVRADRLNLSPTVHFKGKRTPDGTGYAERSPIDRGRAVVAGDWGAQVVEELAVAESDISVSKHRLSGFWDNELDSILRQRGVTTLLFAGVNTDRCVFSTLQDAAFLGYDCVLLDDACSTASPEYVTQAIHFIVKQLHGFVASTGDLLPQLEQLSPSPSSS
jgi:ureidoacrylate peracid hydrolase